MSRDPYGQWDDGQAREPDRYGVPDGRRRTSRPGRPQQPWVPDPGSLDDDPVPNQNPYPGRYSTDGYSSDGYSSDGHSTDGYGADGYRPDGYRADGYSDAGYPAQGGYGAPAGYGSPDYDYGADGYGQPGYDQDGRADYGHGG
jgi:hypothetical protein